MCGIIGYVGREEAAPIMLDGLRRLEYRGYDSAGMALNNGGILELRKCAGRIDNLRDLLGRQGASGFSGVSHTRWATHGAPTDENAHPHTDQSGKIALVHNGVIENYLVIREALQAEGHQFLSQTDTEVLSHLIGKHFDSLDSGGVRPRLVKAIRLALAQVKGTYGIAVVHADEPDFLVGARLGSPLVVGLGKGRTSSRAMWLLWWPTPETRFTSMTTIWWNSPRRTFRSVPSKADDGRTSRSIKSNSPRRKRRWAIIPTSCSRRSTSSRRASPTPSAADLPGKLNGHAWRTQHGAA